MASPMNLSMMPFRVSMMSLAFLNQSDSSRDSSRLGIFSLMAV